MTVCNIGGELKPTQECTFCEKQVCEDCYYVCGFCHKKIVCINCLGKQKGQRAFSHPRCKDDKDEIDL